MQDDNILVPDFTHNHMTAIPITKDRHWRDIDRELFSKTLDSWNRIDFIFKIVEDCAVSRGSVPQMLEKAVLEISSIEDIRYNAFRVLDSKKHSTDEKHDAVRIILRCNRDIFLVYIECIAYVEKVACKNKRGSV